ncbi:unnamed protein product [Rhizophagus irregularis]|nr:unnamed protein product [Rhizophagus irregularis]CAB5330128.1 unnamed protein product [Rhizophagus irregularis]
MKLVQEGIREVCRKNIHTGVLFGIFVSNLSLAFHTGTAILDLRHLSLYRRAFYMLDILIDAMRIFLIKIVEKDLHIVWRTRDEKININQDHIKRNRAGFSNSWTKLESNQLAFQDSL